MNTRLVVYRPTLTDTLVVINNPGSTYPVSDSETVITTDGYSAVDRLVAGDTLTDNAGVIYGVIKSVDGASTVTLYSVTTAIPDNAMLFNLPEKPYDLDLQKAPNIRLNLNWLDIKEPDQRRSNFSQTIKIPFTDSNNNFFENWFDVNLDTLIYNTRKKFKAVILVDSVPQLEGYIQLKSIYLNSRLYEVVVFGDTANFFADIKGKKLREAFIRDDGTVDRQLDHRLTLANVEASWTTGVTTMLETTENDILYPIIDYGHTQLPLCDSMFWNPDYLDPLNANSEVGINSTWQGNVNYYGLITASNLKPAIRIQRLLKIIAARAGYTITSTFLGLNNNAQDIDTFFGRQFMTLAPQYERTRVKVYQGFSASTTTTVSELFGYNQASTGYAYNLNLEPIEFNIIESDTNGILNAVNFLGETVPTLYIPYDPDSGDEAPFGEVVIQVNFSLYLAPTTVAGTTIQSYNVTQSWNWNYGMAFTQQTVNVNPSVGAAGVEVQFTQTLSILDFVNYAPFMQVTIAPVFASGNLGNGLFLAGYYNGSIQTINLGEGLFNNGGINGEVIMEHNMPDITQGDFVKDLCSRYNLIVTSNPSNAKNLIIEPYQDYIAGGETKYWTDKLDVSKEQIIKSTNEMQKRTLLFSDLENQDILNKSYIDKWERVYGSIEQINNNDFATGNFKNHSIYAPFIAQGIGHWAYNMQGMTPNNQVAIAYNFEVDDNGNKHPITDGKPMLFYYSGTPITLTDMGDQWDNNWEFNIISGVYTMLGDTEALNVNNKFPLCTQYNLSTIGGGVNSATKILHWEYYNPQFLTGYTFNIFGDTQSIHGFYNDYWASYINEIYSDEARIMECNIHLNEDDIANFSFKNPVYIKNTLWRVLSVDSYVVGGNETTKVKLIKAISKLNYDCQYIQYAWTGSGQILFTNINTGDVGYNVTNECCKDANQTYWYEETLPNLGLGVCYWGMVAAGGNAGGLNGGGAGGGGGTPAGGEDIPISPPVALPMLPIQDSNTQVIRRNANLPAQESTFYLECVTQGSTAGNLRQQNVNDRIINLPPNTMAYINVELTGNIVGGTGGNTGKVGFFEYYSVLKSPASNEKSYAGSTSQYKDKEQRDNDFPEPTVDISTFGSDNSLKLTITHSGNNTTNWLAKVKLLITGIAPNGEPIGEIAIFQNGSGILYQDFGFLLWN